MHAFALGNAVAGGNRVELGWHTAGFPHTLLDPLCQLAQMEMPRVDLAPRVDDANQWLAEIIIVVAHRPVQGARVSAVQSRENTASIHAYSPISWRSAWTSSHQLPTFQRP